MYNLLIVDDEATVVSGFAYDIDWSALEIDEVYTAATAQQALDLLHASRVDVVISDIRMPGIDGLELTRIIRSCWPYAKVILVSGYEEFEYAQQAVALGVLEYVTKPVPYAELTRAVRRAIDAVNHDLEQARIVRDAEQQLQALLPAQQERLLNEWIVQGRTDVVALLPTYQIRLDPVQPILLLLLRVDEWLNTSEQRDARMSELVLQNLVREILLRDAEALFFSDPDNHQIVLIQASDSHRLGELHRYLEAMVEPLQMAARRTLGGVVSLFWDAPFATLDDAPAAYRRMLDRSRRRLAWGSGVLMGREVDPTTTSKSLNALAQYPPLYQLAESLQQGAMIGRIEGVFRELDAQPAVAYELLLEVYHTICGALVQASNKRGAALHEWAGETLPFFTNFEQIRSIEALRRWSLAATRQYMSAMLGRETHQPRRLVERAKRLIQEQFTEELSLEKLAAQLFLHPKYLSRLFKKEVGLSPTDYHIRLRIERAQQLLHQPGIKVYEVAEQVGYNSIAHFNRIFKREVGLTPKDFQDASIGAGDA